METNHCTVSSTRFPNVRKVRVETSRDPSHGEDRMRTAPVWRLLAEDNANWNGDQSTGGETLHHRARADDQAAGSTRRLTGRRETGGYLVTAKVCLAAPDGSPSAPRRKVWNRPTRMAAEFVTCRSS